MGAYTMKKLTSAWFEFAGARNTDKGVRLLSLPVRYHPAARGEFLRVPGRDGTLWAGEDAFDDVTVRVQCQTCLLYTSRRATRARLPSSPIPPRPRARR